MWQNRAWWLRCQRSLTLLDVDLYVGALPPSDQRQRIIFPIESSPISKFEIYDWAIQRYLVDLSQCFSPPPFVCVPAATFFFCYYTSLYIRMKSLANDNAWDHHCVEGVLQTDQKYYRVHAKLCLLQIS